MVGYHPLDSVSIKDSKVPGIYMFKTADLIIKQYTMGA